MVNRKTICVLCLYLGLAEAMGDSVSRPVLLPLASSWQRMPEPSLPRSPDFVNTFSPLMDTQVINFRWQGAGQVLRLCGNSLAVWELAPPDQQRVVIKPAQDCFWIEPQGPEGYTQLYALNIDTLDREKSVIETGTGIWPLSSIVPRYEPDTLPRSNQESIFMWLGLNPGGVVPENTQVANGSLAVLDTRNIDPLKMIVQCGGCCSKSETSSPGSGHSERKFSTIGSSLGSDDPGQEQSGAGGFSSSNGGDKPPPYSPNDQLDSEAGYKFETLILLILAMNEEQQAAFLTFLREQGLLPADVERLFNKERLQAFLADINDSDIINVWQWVAQNTGYYQRPTGRGKTLTTMERKLPTLPFETTATRASTPDGAYVEPNPESIYEEVFFDDDGYVPIIPVSTHPVSTEAMKTIVKEAMKEVFQEVQAQVEPTGSSQSTPLLLTVQNTITSEDGITQLGSTQVVYEENDVPCGWSEEDEINTMPGLPPQPLSAPHPAPEPGDGFHRD